METKIKEQAIELLNYLYLGKEIQKSDGIIGLGSIDYKVAEKCAELYLKGYGNYIIFTGNCGKGTEGIITQTEAENFRDIAIQKGVPKEIIYLEKNATNTYENYLYSDSIIKENNLTANSLVVVGKPYQETRCYAIAKQLFKNRKIYITSPEFSPISFEEYYKDNPNTNLFEIVSEIVAEINILEKTPQFKLQTYQEIPKQIKTIYQNMIEEGFDKYLLTEEVIKKAVLKLKQDSRYASLDFNI